MLLTQLPLNRWASFLHSFTIYVTPEEDPGVTEEKKIGDLLMQRKNANPRFAFLLCFLNLLQEAKGITNGQRLKHRTYEDISGQGAY